MRNCGDRDFPSIFVRLDDPQVLDFISSALDGKKFEGKFLRDTYIFKSLI